MEISNQIREIFVFATIILFIGSIFYSLVIDDKEPAKKHN